MPRDIGEYAKDKRCLFEGIEAGLGRYERLKKIIGYAATIGAISLFIWCAYHIVFPTHDSIKAVQGHADLSQWDFRQREIVFLNGEWELFPQGLFQPAELAVQAADFIQVPGHWNQRSARDVQPLRGNATYRLTVKLADSQSQAPLALKIQNVWMAHRLFINGVMVKEMGLPAESREEYKAGNIPYVIPLEPAEELELVLQISNQIYYTGGVAHPIQLGYREAIEFNSMLSVGSDMTLFFIFILFGLYHLHMYQMRNKESTYLFSGLCLIAVSLFFLTSGEKLLLRLAEEVPFEAAHKLQSFSLPVSMAILSLFIRSLEPGLVKPKLLGVLLAPIIAYLGFVIVTPYHFYTWAEPYFIVYPAMLLFFLAIRFSYLLVKKRVRQLPPNEAFWVTAGMVFIGVTVSGGMLYYVGQLDTKLLSGVSLLGFLLSLNIFLARRFTNNMDEVQALSGELQKANQIKDEFLARTSHELKTPLHGLINISAHLLKEGEDNLTQGQRENLFIIRDTSRKLSLLVNDLVDVIKLQYEDLQMKLTTVDLYVIVHTVFQLLSFNLQGKQVQLINRVRPMTFVKADENRLTQILYNISSNAVKYTEKGEVAVRTEEVAGNVIVTMTDTGRGISREQWERVFEEFYRGPSSAHDFYEGMGLGLYISRRLVRNMQGDLWISDSMVNKGTTLSLRLPKSEYSGNGSAVKPGAAGWTYAKPARTAAPGDLGRKTILLVDDEPTNIQVLSLMLEEEYRTLAAYGGEEALRLLQQEKVHLVIADVMMPGMSGIQLTQKIRKAYSMIQLPIIIATVRDSDRDIELAYQTGANDYITKPFTAKEIHARARILLQLAETMETALQHEIAFLQAQIKPHFIYNALSNVIALCYEDGEKAARILSLLSRYLRYIFQADQSRQMLELQQELDIIKAYVEIEKLRFGGRLCYQTDIDPNVSNIMIPALLIQPLVENAIRHGLFNKEGEGTVTLTISEEAELVRIVVEDDGIGMEQELVNRMLREKAGRGVGIPNIQRRIAAFPQASFHIHSQLEKGTRCVLRFSKELLKT